MDESKTIKKISKILRKRDKIQIIIFAIIACYNIIAASVTVGNITSVIFTILLLVSYFAILAVIIKRYKATQKRRI